MQTGHYLYSLRISHPICPVSKCDRFLTRPSHARTILHFCTSWFGLAQFAYVLRQVLEGLHYGVPLGSKVCIFSGTKNNFSGTKNNISGTKNNFSGTKNNFSGTKNNFSGTKINFSPTNIIFSPTKIIFSPTKIIFSGTKINFSPTKNTDF